MASPINRTQQFVYLQSKANHYHKLKNTRPTIRTFRTQKISSTIDTRQIDKHPSVSPSRLRNYSVMKQYDQMKSNQNLVSHILNIRYRQKCRVQAEGLYSRYNDYNTARISKYGTFKQNQRSKSIDYQNSKLGQKIIKMKPSIGTIADWNCNFQNVKSRRKIVSKIKENHNISIYSKNKFIPEYYRTFLDRDGSTVAIKQKIFELPKVIAITHIDLEKKHKRQQKIGVNFAKIIKDASGQINKSL